MVRQNVRGAREVRDGSDRTKLSGEAAMGNEKKCKHTACNCTVAENESYCSGYCEDAQKLREDTEIQCDCKHPACEL